MTDASATGAIASRSLLAGIPVTRDNSVSRRPHGGRGLGLRPRLELALTQQRQQATRRLGLGRLAQAATGR